MRRLWVNLGLLALVAAVFAFGAWRAYRRWQVVTPSVAHAEEHEDHHDHNHGHDHDQHPADQEHAEIRLSPQAKKNLQLVVKPVSLSTYWRKIEMPAVLIDRAGMSDIAVVAPVTGVVTEILSHPGETLPPGSPLFKLRLTSESLHASQRELFKTTRDIDIAQQQRRRLQSLAQEGALAQSRILEIDNTLQRLEVNLEAYRQELMARGFDKKQVELAASGQFVTEIIVYAPAAKHSEKESVTEEESDQRHADTQPQFRFEFEQLHIALGEQAEAGQLLCKLADHRNLLVEGHGFRDDLPLVQRAAKQGLPIQLEIEKQEGLTWSELPSELFIHHIENTIDPDSRTFAFHLLLQNQWQTYTQGQHTGVLWRFQPGDRLRLSIAVEKTENVMVVPREAVVREGPEAYVFVEHGDHLERTAVRILTEDRTNIVLASDDQLHAGAAVAQNGAASLNRVLKAQQGGAPADEHHHDH